MGSRTKKIDSLAKNMTDGFDPSYKNPGLESEATKLFDAVNEACKQAGRPEEWSRSLQASLNAKIEAAANKLPPEELTACLVNVQNWKIENDPDAKIHDVQQALIAILGRIHAEKADHMFEQAAFAASNKTLQNEINNAHKNFQNGSFSENDVTSIEQASQGMDKSSPQGKKMQTFVRCLKALCTLGGSELYRKYQEHKERKQEVKAQKASISNVGAMYDDADDLNERLNENERTGRHTPSNR